MKHSKSALFLMELIIALFFFALASTVCVRLFAKSATLSQRTVTLTEAVNQAQNLAECFLSLDGELSQLQQLFPHSRLYDENSLILEEEKYISTIIRTFDDENGLVCGDITIYNTAEEELYTLHISHHTPERRAHLE